MITLWNIDDTKRVSVKVVHADNKDRAETINSEIIKYGGTIVNNGDPFDILVIDDEYSDIDIPSSDYLNSLITYCLSATQMWQVTNMIQSVRISRYDKIKW